MEKKVSYRKPAVAGYFYPGTKDKLLSFLQRYPAHKEKVHAKGVIVPHAGYIYSGEVAAKVYQRVEIPSTVILIGPNHTGLGATLSLDASGAWETPLGEVSINREISDKLREHIPMLTPDTVAHLKEHSLEVQLPFLQHFRPDVTIVPILLKFHRYELAKELGESLGKALYQERGKVLLIASSDLNHYESDSVTREKDTKALQAIEAMDSKMLFDVCENHNITMCGLIPAIVVMEAVKQWGATQAKIIAHTTSGEVSGDFQQVVGYGGVVFL